MRHRIILSLGLLGLSVGLLGAGVVSAQDVTQESGTVISKYDISNYAESHDHDEINENARLIGYRWRCYDCNTVSALHTFASTAVTKANAHAAKTGHKVTVYDA